MPPMSGMIIQPQAMTPGGDSVRRGEARGGRRF